MSTGIFAMIALTLLLLACAMLHESNQRAERSARLFNAHRSAIHRAATSASFDDSASVEVGSVEWWRDVERC